MRIHGAQNALGMLGPSITLALDWTVERHEDVREGSLETTWRAKLSYDRRSMNESTSAPDPPLCDSQYTRLVGLRRSLASIRQEADSLVVPVIYEELQRLGWIEGRNLRLDHRFAPSDLNRLRAEAAELVRLARNALAAASTEASVQLFTISVSDVADIRAAIENFAAEPNGGLILGRGLPLELQREFPRLAEQYRLPSISGPPSDRALMSYSTDNAELLHKAVAYVDRILRGAKVSDLPVQYPTRFRLVINLKTAKAIGVEIPTTLRALADEVIE